MQRAIGERGRPPASSRGRARGTRARDRRARSCSAAGEHAARGVEDLAPARAVDERDLDAALARRARPRRWRARWRARARSARSRAARRGVAHERRVGDDPLARVGRAVGLRDVDAAGPRPERRAEEGWLRDVARRAPRRARARRARRVRARGRRGRSRRRRRRGRAPRARAIRARG